MQMFFDHERLEVYQVARELNREVASLLGELPRGTGESADNLRRACASIPRNIAEGTSKGTAADRANFYRIARGSATEVAASLDELVDFGFATAERVTKAKQLAWRVVSMLVNLIRSTQRSDSPRAIPPKERDGPRQ